MHISSFPGGGGKSGAWNIKKVMIGKGVWGSILMPEKEIEIIFVTSPMDL